MTQLNFQCAERYQHQRAIGQDTVLQFLRTHTPAEVEAYVEANVNNLAQAKAVLKVLAKVVAYLARREFA